jgi:hypothetical protein
MQIILKTILCSIMLLMALSSCDFRPQVGPPWMQEMLTQGPEGPTKFREGWRDGCESGISATSNQLQRSYYKFKQNYELSQDPVYYTGWKTAFDHCQRYVFQYLRRNII